MWALTFSVLCGDDGGDPTPNPEVCFHFQMPWVQELDQLITNFVGDRFVKSTRVSEGPKVHFQAFQLHAKLIGGVTDLDGREVGLAC